MTCRDQRSDSLPLRLPFDGLPSPADFGVAAQLTDNKSRRHTFVGTPFWCIHDLKLPIQTLSLTFLRFQLALLAKDGARGVRPSPSASEHLSLSQLTRPSSPVPLQDPTGSLRLQGRHLVARHHRDRARPRRTAPVRVPPCVRSRLARSSSTDTAYRRCSHAGLVPYPEGDAARARGPLFASLQRVCRPLSHEEYDLGASPACSSVASVQSADVACLSSPLPPSPLE